MEPARPANLVAPSTAEIRQIAYQEPAAPPQAGPAETAPLSSPPASLPAEQSAASAELAPRSSAIGDVFAGQAELSLEQLVADVQARNPSLQAMSAAWAAAAQRYPQVVSLDDPMFEWMVSPSGLGKDEGGGWMVELSQKYPWPCKRHFKGRMAQAEAEAARGEIGDVRLRLVEMTRTAFFDYYLARRQLEVNAETTKLVGQFRDIAKTKYEANQATEQDVLRADVELADLEGRRIELVRDEQIAVARINTLLHQEADCRLPPPPAQLAAAEDLPPVEALQEAALGARPDLYTLGSRIRAEEANLALQCREYYPDVELRGRYDGFMPEDMRPQVGMGVNVPLRLGRRDAAVREAQARIQQRRAEYWERVDRVRFEVQSAYQQVSQAQQVVRLFSERILPAAEQSFQSAQANYGTGRVDFLRLIDAERQLNTERERYYQTIAEYHRRAAALSRAVGGTLPEGDGVR